MPPRRAERAARDNQNDDSHWSNLAQVALTVAQAEKHLRSLKALTRKERDLITALLGEPQALVAAQKILAKEAAEPVLWGALMVYAARGAAGASRPTSRAGPRRPPAERRRGWARR